MNGDFRQLALAVLDKIRTGRGLATGLFQDIEAPIHDYPGLVSLAYELVFGVLRNRMLLDNVLLGCCRSRPQKIPNRVKDILRIGTYQLLFMRKIPPHAAVEQTVQLAKRTKGHRVAAFVNALLRSVALRGKGTLARLYVQSPPTIRYSLPDWIANEMQTCFGDLWHLEAQAFSCQPPVSVRVRTDRISRRVFVEKLRDIGVNISCPQDLPCAVVIRSGHIFRQVFRSHTAWFLPQDINSQRVSTIFVKLISELRIRRLLDLCCGRGVKTLWIAQFLPEAEIVSVDISHTRLCQAQALLKHYQVELVRASGQIKLPFEAGRFDAALLDAPCSGLGTLRRHPELKWLRKPQDLRTNSATQIALLRSAIEATRSGGIVLYAVCTFTKAETEDVIEAVISTASRRVVLLPLEEGECTLLMRPSLTGGDAFFLAALVVS